MNGRSHQKQCKIADGIYYKMFTNTKSHVCRSVTVPHQLSVGLAAVSHSLKNNTQNKKNHTKRKEKKILKEDFLEESHKKKKKRFFKRKEKNQKRDEMEGERGKPESSVLAVASDFSLSSCLNARSAYNTHTTTKQQQQQHTLDGIKPRQVAHGFIFLTF